jgi:hypothetical protein
MNFPDKVYKTGPRLFAVIAKSKSMYGQLAGNRSGEKYVKIT